MIKNNFSKTAIRVLIPMALSSGISFNVLGHGSEDHSGAAIVPGLPDCQILAAARLFDGIDFPHENKAVLIEGNKIKQIGSLAELSSLCANQLDLGDSTILPGFIESHAHITFQNVNKNSVLKHGITTVQDTGGPLMAAEGGQGTLRLLSVGPIIQAVGGYPLNVFGGGEGGLDKIAIQVASVAEAEQVVADLVAGGATAIKLALEPGGETGAPWMQPHDGHAPPETPWPMLSQDIANAIVAKAHALGKRVLVHAGENTGFERALNAGVDEFAHIPCAEIKEDLLQRAVDQGVTFVTTIDTLASCVDTATGKGIHSNTMSLTSKGAKFIYGSEIGHDNVPWGINGEEFHMMLHLTSGESIDFTDVVNVFKAATSKAGEHLGLAPLGTIAPDAPADIIAVRGNPFEKFKILEYPDLVLSGGRAVVNNYINHSSEEKINCFFNWAEGRYSGALAPTGAATQVSGVYSYRYYPETKAYLGVSSVDHHLYYLKEDDGQLHDQGLLVNWLPVSECN